MLLIDTNLIYQIERKDKYGLIKACQYYDIDCIKLINIDKINDHSSVLVMDRIKTQIIDYFRWFFNSDNI